LHERFEAISVLYKQMKHPSYIHMIRQLIERLPMIVDGEPLYLPILDEIVKLIMNMGNLTVIDLAIQKIKNMIS
jgi:hypothetical protein